VNAPADEVRLYSSWRGLVLAFLSPVLLLGIAALAIQAEGLHVVATVILVIGVGMLLVSLFDFPIYTTFDATGIRRRTPLRTHKIRWNKVIAVNRARGGRRTKRAGPLAAAVGKRRYLLVDRTESVDEYQSLQQLLSEDGVETPLSAVAPDPKTVPTWLYHQKQRQG
jgi:hypothetical protein